MGFFTTLGFVFVIVVFYNFFWKRRKLPPGPIPLPILGNIPLRGKIGKGHEDFVRWRNEYGSIYTFWISEIPIVCIADYELMQETFVKNGDAYAGRLTIEKMDNFFRGGRAGIVFTDGPVWREQRRFALSVFRNFGMGRMLMEQKVLNEVLSFLDSLKGDTCGACDLPWQFEVCVGSIINDLLFGYRFEGERLSEFKFFKQLLSDHMRSIVDVKTALMVQELDVMKYVFPGKYKMLQRNKKLFFDFFYRQIDEHEKELDLDSIDEPSDYVEAFLREIHKSELANDADSTFNKRQLANMCLDLWFAGMETTANTLQFTVLYLLHDAEALGNVYAELDRVIGSSRLITWNDRANLPVLQATINESQRLANLLPLNLVHQTTKEVTVRGYVLPAGTYIVPQLSNILFDEKVFPNAEKFDPSRFLDDEGKLRKIDEFQPFSVGKRQCLGESLAKMELFLILANLFNQFQILPEDPKHPPSLQRVPGITWQPKHYNVQLQRRQHHH